MGVIKTTCNTQDVNPRFIQLTADVPPAIPDFCGKADNLKSGPGSSENKQIGNKQQEHDFAFATYPELPVLHSREDSPQVTKR
jgi:hypothetical protein